MLQEERLQTYLCEGMSAAATEFGKAIADLDALDAKLSELEAMEGQSSSILATQSINFEGIESTLAGPLATSMAKFRRRCHDVDPVTGQGRYGEQMRKKVLEALTRFDGLLERSTRFRLEIMDVALAEMDQVKKAEEEARRKQEEEKAKVLELERQKAEEQAKQEAIQAQIRKEEEEKEKEALAQEAARVRVLKQAAAEEAEAAAERARQKQKEEDDAFMASVALGVPGAETSLAQLKQSIGEGNLRGYKEAVSALVLYVGNIIAHPEEAQYKKIRHENATFKSKVGQYQGGPQVLIAAGFKMERDEEGLLLYVIEEPNIEIDYPTWTAWYDAVKAVRDRLKEEEDKIKKMR